MYKVLQLCAVHSKYHAVYFDPTADDEDELIYVDVPMFAVCETTNGKIEICPMIVLRNGDVQPAWETENYIGCAEVDVNDEDFWLGMRKEQEDERKKMRKKSGKKSRTQTSHSRHTDEEEEQEEEEEEEDDKPQGDVHLSSRKR